MRPADPRLWTATTRTLKVCNFSTANLGTAVKTANPTLTTWNNHSNSFKPHLVFPKGPVGTLDGFIRAQKRRHEDKAIWDKLLLLHKYGAYYDEGQHRALRDVDADYWRSLAAIPNLYDALQRLVADERLNFTDHPLFPHAESLYVSGEKTSIPSPPVWLLLHLITNRVNTTRHAQLAFDLALNQLRYCPKPYRFPMLLLAVYGLLKFNLTAYTLKHVDIILNTPTTTPEFHYNELLAICGRLSKNQDSRILLLKVLNKMKDKSVPVNRHISSRLAIHCVAYPDIAALVSGPRRVIRDWGHSYKPHYHVLPNYRSAMRRLRTAKMSRMSVATVLETLNSAKPNTQPLMLDSHEWSALISSVGRDQNVGLDTFRALWRRVQSYRGSGMDIATQTAVMDAFRQRGQYSDAIAVWESILNTPGNIDKRALAAAVMSLCAASRYKEAFDALDAFAFKNHIPQDEESSHSRTQWIEQRGRIKLDVAMINGLMDRLNRGGRPDAVFKLWDVMEKYYGVWPDGITMAILLDAARRAYLIDPTIELTLNQLGLFNPLKKLWLHKQVPETPSAIISKMLSKPPESGFWHGDWAFINARVIFRDAVLGNWPHLQQVECPVGAYSPQSVSDRLWVTTDKIPEMRWPTVIPIDKTFHAYIFLLGWNELQAEIPIVLAWMRALQIAPMHKTLCAALMYFGEVARLPPLFESFELRRGQEYGGDYGKLRRWIADWVGESALPSENNIAAYRRGDGQQKMRWYGRKY
ncbi:hypothetical protein FRC14_002469 [Serendipita sp. 396]|nr:hypothetical protein FRC14_002469 [Serendipita sp. 396]KAG8788674.1 hypothetical protein FRC15_002831 [Serendipita sp. 397]KAG8803783.1 hypothetical protein FRC16_002989 [Serendipita sp. 398]KAG8827383.1 hypothetical protein FRC19_003532 [Serendipita sp. 401]KAG8838300.1 hypothetical protein FRC18_005216 [Serendipita sp. 400]KAG8860444.1 hypothetical protein FRB91_003139 [Serendipita sp. 411]KAG8875620.1 hypothetical protein FRC20_003487 [Serendipita sp. 405]KAG9057882.1 hypothetical prot